MSWLKKRVFGPKLSASPRSSASTSYGSDYGSSADSPASGRMLSVDEFLMEDIVEHSSSWRSEDMVDYLAKPVLPQLLRLPAHALEPSMSLRRDSVAGESTSIGLGMVGIPLERAISVPEPPRSLPKSPKTGASCLTFFGDLQPIDQNGVVCAETSLSSRGDTTNSCTFVNMLPPALLGEGQYGIVWRARSTRTNEWRAAKTLKVTRQDADRVMRERDTAELIRKRPHPSVVRFFGIHCFGDGSLSTLVMELCTGGDLQARIASERGMAEASGRLYEAPANATDWVEQILLGLEHLHVQLGLLYLDLKPANVVLNGKDQAKIIDFGLACPVKEHKSKSLGCPSGSPGYIAPEIWEDEDVDFRADIYSFGVVAWVLLTGGALDKQEPSPPMNCIEDDADLLARCIESPGDNAAVPLPEAWRYTIARVTSRERALRPEHGEILTAVRAAAEKA